MPCDVGIIDLIFHLSNMSSTGILSRAFPYCEINKIMESL